MGHPLATSSTDIMATTATSSPAFLPLTADEKQALTDIYGSTPISLSASERKRFCITANAANAAQGGGGTGTGTGGSGSGSCSLSCPFPQVVEPNSCSCVCALTASSCFPNFVDAQACQCYSVTHSFCFNSCPQGSFADPSLNCQCVPEIGAQGSGSCDPTKQVGDSPDGTQCP